MCVSQRGRLGKGGGLNGYSVSGGSYCVACNKKLNPNKITPITSHTFLQTLDINEIVKRLLIDSHMLVVEFSS